MLQLYNTSKTTTAVQTVSSLIVVIKHEKYVMFVFFSTLENEKTCAKSLFHFTAHEVFGATIDEIQNRIFSKKRPLSIKRPSPIYAHPKIKKNI